MIDMAEYVSKNSFDWVVLSVCILGIYSTIGMASLVYIAILLRSRIDKLKQETRCHERWIAQLDIKMIQMDRMNDFLLRPADEHDGKTDN